MYSEEVDYDEVSDFSSVFCIEGEVRSTQTEVMAHGEGFSGNDPLTDPTKCNNQLDVK